MPQNLMNVAFERCQYALVTFLGFTFLSNLYIYHFWPWVVVGNPYSHVAGVPAKPRFMGLARFSLRMNCTW